MRTGTRASTCGCPEPQADAVVSHLRNSVRFRLLQYLQKEASRSTVFALAALTVGSVCLRSLFAIKHTGSRMFPDEYIYASLGRSIAHGHYAIRGVTAHFPAALEPLLAAPAWRAFSTTTAYHVIQVENAALVSLACIPIYLLSRYVGLPRRYSYACAAYSLAIPSLVYVGFTASDPAGYLFALFALAAGVRSLDRPSRKRQVVFLAFVGLAILARVEYIALIGAYLLSGSLLEQRRFPRAHSIVLCVLGLTVIGATVVGPSRAAGFYAHSGIFHVSASDVDSIVHWCLIHVYLFALSSGVVIVPGAVAGLMAPRDRRARVFSLMTMTLAAILIVAASIYSAVGVLPRFQERYIFMLLPLLSIAFALYVQRGKPLRPISIAIALALIIALSRLPLSAYAVPGLTDASPFLFAVAFAQSHLGVGSASLAVAAMATTAALAAVLVAFRGNGLACLWVSVIALTTVSSAATANDLARSESARAMLPSDLTWIDDAVRGTVTAIATPDSQPRELLHAMYWNTSVQREVVADDGLPTDTFSAPKLEIGKDGRLLNVRGDVLFDAEGTTGRLADARVLIREHPFVLWRPKGAPRFRLLIEGRYSDQWLSGLGRVRAWPASAGETARISFTLVVPPARTTNVRVVLGGYHVTVRSGSALNVVCAAAAASRHIDLRFSSPDVVVDQNLRTLSLKLTRIQVTDVRPAPGGHSRSSCSAA
jgi:hypothetical protein